MSEWKLKFHPQVWDSSDYAVNVPPLGVDEFPIDDRVAALCRAELDNSGFIDNIGVDVYTLSTTPPWITAWVNTNNGTGYFDLIDRNGDVYTS